MSAKELPANSFIASLFQKIESSGYSFAITTPSPIGGKGAISPGRVYIGPGDVTGNKK